MRAARGREPPRLVFFIAAAMPTTIHSKRAFVIPEGVTVDVASRAVTVKGTRGTSRARPGV